MLFSIEINYNEINNGVLIGGFQSTVSFSPENNLMGKNNGYFERLYLQTLPPVCNAQIVHILPMLRHQVF